MRMLTFLQADWVVKQAARHTPSIYKVQPGIHIHNANANYNKIIALLGNIITALSHNVHDHAYMCYRYTNWREVMWDKLYLTHWVPTGWAVGYVG